MMFSSIKKMWKWLEPERGSPVVLLEPGIHVQLLLGLGSALTRALYTILSFVITIQGFHQMSDTTERAQ